jgi:hypothetical protein
MDYLREGTSVMSYYRLLGEHTELSKQYVDMKAAVSTACDNLIEFCSSIPEEFKPSCRAIWLLLNDFSNNPVDYTTVMSRQEYRTARSRLTDEKFVSTKRVIGSPMRGSALKSLHAAIVVSFFYDNSYPSSRNQRHLGFIFFSPFSIISEKNFFRRS